MYSLGQLLRFVLVLVLVVVAAAPLEAQHRGAKNAPSSLKELRQRINAERHLPGNHRTRTISALRSRSAR